MSLWASRWMKMVNSPPARGKGRQALGWAEEQRNPPRRCAPRLPTRGFSGTGSGHIPRGRYRVLLRIFKSDPFANF